MKKKSLTNEDSLRLRAMALIDRQKTIVLATSDQDQPWAAPVYYVYIAPTFFFFSSQDSKHIEQAINNGVVSSALFADADQWEQIEGLQMVGQIDLIDKPIQRLKVTAAYLNKFPVARSLLTDKASTDLDLRKKVRLYAFLPKRIFYMNNQLGFGSRTEITLS